MIQAGFSDQIQQWFQAVNIWAETHVLQFYTFLQISVIAAAVVTGGHIGRRIRTHFAQKINALNLQQIYLANLCKALVQQMPQIMVLIILWLGMIGLRDVLKTTFLMTLAVNLLFAWLLIRLATSVLMDRFWSGLVTTMVWILVALNILGILGPAIGFLEKFGVTIGSVHITVITVVKASIVLILLFRVSTWLTELLEKKLHQVPNITPSTHVLLSKIIKITLFFFIFLVAINSVGLDLTALAVFSGAVGVGVGFGLQKVVGNFVSGIILLIDKSIKPGDVIQIGDTYGWIVQLRGRYVSVNTRDGRELLIPNEDLITQQVINWSYSNPFIRLKVPVGISYKNNPHHAIAVMLEAVKSVSRLLTDPAPKCLLMGFGDSSVDLELRFWIADPQNGINSVRSDVMLKIWDALQEAGIEIPFPQRDLHLKTATVPINVMGKEEAITGCDKGERKV